MGCVKGVTGVRCLCKDCVEQRNLFDFVESTSTNKKVKEDVK